MKSPPSPKKRLTRLSAVARWASADVADEGIGSGDDDAAADSEHKQKHDDGAIARRARQSIERNGNERESEDEAGLLAFVVEQGSDGEGCEDESEGLGEGDGPVLAGGEVEALGQLGKDRAEHGSDHAVNEDGDNGGEDEQGCRPQGLKPRFVRNETAPLKPRPCKTELLIPG